MKPKGLITKQQGYLAGILLISIFMTAVMSLGMLIVREPGNLHFLQKWKNDFVLGCSIAIPAGYVLVPGIQKLIDLITK